MNSFLPCYDLLVARWYSHPNAALQQRSPPPPQLPPLPPVVAPTAPSPAVCAASSAAAAPPPAPLAADAAALSWREGADKAKKAAKPWKYEVAEEDDEVTEFVNCRLQAQADAWPADAPPPPCDDHDALDPDGPWGLAVCGVAIRSCEDDPAKGRGAFATRPIAAGAVVGVYWGEYLTQRAHAARHGWRSGTTVADLTRREHDELAARARRLHALGADGPMHGADNGSAYCFSLLPDDLLAALGSTMLPSRPAYIDGEDPNLSSWCRYVNHCAETHRECTLEPKCDGHRGLVWFEARRPIAAGEELAFDYSEHYRWDVPGSGRPERRR